MTEFVTLYYNSCNPFTTLLTHFMQYQLISESKRLLLYLRLFDKNGMNKIIVSNYEEQGA